MSCIVQPWSAGTITNPENAQLLRGILRYSGQMRGRLRWTPFPQTCCSFAFGTKSRPLPVGALLHLWEHQPVFSTTCAICGGRALVTSWVGLLSVGGLWATCVQCGRAHGKPINGIGEATSLIVPALRGTEFAVSASRFGGAFSGLRLPLWRALGRLGASDLPPESWARTAHRPGISCTIAKQPAAIEYGRGRSGATRRSERSRSTSRHSDT